MRKFLLISVKPEFANKIISKHKLIELRKNKPCAQVGDYVIIYSTIPVKAIVGFAKIENIIESSPEEMWDKHSKKLGIDKLRFDEYYAKSVRSIGLELSCVCKIRNNIPLESIRSIYPKFTPPQSYKYVSLFSAYRVYKKYVN